MAMKNFSAMILLSKWDLEPFNYLYMWGYNKQLSLLDNLQVHLESVGCHMTVPKAGTVLYDWALLNNRDIRDKYTLTLRNKFYALQEISEIPRPNDEDENFVKNALLEAATESMPTKQRAKPRVPWETLAVW